MQQVIRMNAQLGSIAPVDPASPAEAVKRAIERAGRINVSIAELCRRAGIQRTTLTRWRDDATSPSLRSFSWAMRRIDTELTLEEDRLRKALAEEAA